MSDCRPGNDPWVCVLCGSSGEHAHLHASVVEGGLVCESCCRDERGAEIATAEIEARIRARHLPS